MEAETSKIKLPADLVFGGRYLLGESSLGRERDSKKESKRAQALVSAFSCKNTTGDLTFMTSSKAPPLSIIPLRAEK